MTFKKLFLTLTLLGSCGLIGQTQAADADETAWNNGLKKTFVGDKPVEEGNSVVELVVPYRAEDPSLVPISINAKIPQTPERYIKTLTVVIDNNPVPFSAKFDLTPDVGKADLAMRMRVNAYTYIRAIAETNDGKLYMNKAFVKASGGCSAPIAGDLDAALARMGKMKFKLDGDKLALRQPNAAQLLISHPNITGLQMDQISRLVRPAHYVDEVKVSYDSKPLITAKTDIAISADPNFRFSFVPDKVGELKVEIKDNLGNKYSAAQAVGP